MEKQEIDEINSKIARFMGLTFYPKCKTPSYFYECENYKWEELDEEDVWVEGETAEFKKTPCTSLHYWDIERDIMKKQWGNWYYSLKYHESWDWIMPVLDHLRSPFDNKFPIIEISFSLGVIVKMYYGGEWHSIEGNNALETIWLSIAEFLNWYNEMQDNNNTLP